MIKTIVTLSLVLLLSNSFVSALNIGDRGKEVTALQKMLNSKGYKLPVTGYYGPLTKSAHTKYLASLPKKIATSTVSTAALKVSTSTTPILATTTPKVATSTIYIPQNAKGNIATITYSSRSYKVNGTYPIFVTIKVKDKNGVPVKDQAMTVSSMDGKEYKLPTTPGLQNGTRDMADWTFTDGGFWEYSKSFYFERSGINVIVVNAPNLDVYQTFDIDVK